MPNTETPIAPRHTEEQPVGRTFTLWLWPYFCLREEARPVLSGLTKVKADEIIDREKGRAPRLDVPRTRRDVRTPCLTLSGDRVQAVVGR